VAVTASEARELVLQRLGMRVGPETAAYVARRLDAQPRESIPVMGTDARTGAPLRRFLDPNPEPRTLNPRP
jgi:hypothetical protein